MRQEWFVSRWLTKSILLRRCLSLLRLFRHGRRLFPVVRMGGLAGDQTFKGQGLGGALLADALTGAARSEIAACALVVAAKGESAATFCRHHGVCFSAGPVVDAVLASGVRVACQWVSIWADNFHADSAFLMFRPLRCSLWAAPAK